MARSSRSLVEEVRSARTFSTCTARTVDEMRPEYVRLALAAVEHDDPEVRAIARDLLDSLGVRR